MVSGGPWFPCTVVLWDWCWRPAVLETSNLFGRSWNKRYRHCHTGLSLILQCIYHKQLHLNQRKINHLSEKVQLGERCKLNSKIFCFREVSRFPPFQEQVYNHELCTSTTNPSAWIWQVYLQFITHCFLDFCLQKVILLWKSKRWLNSQSFRLYPMVYLATANFIT